MNKKLRRHLLRYSFTLSLIGAVLLFLLAAPFVLLISNTIDVQAVGILTIP